MEEASIGRWLKSVGDEVMVGEELCEIETEKVTTVYQSPSAGRLVEIVAKQGDIAEVGGVLCRLETTT
jgi:pyruvate/2-oxoglutarate dehydrogenase complex dihydrolipoamide acyltransferase (E2) component